jgi:hypothetical protein
VWVAFQADTKLRVIEEGSSALYHPIKPRSKNTSTAGFVEALRAFIDQHAPKAIETALTDRDMIARLAASVTRLQEELISLRASVATSAEAAAAAAATAEKQKMSGQDSKNAKRSSGKTARTGKSVLGIAS